MTLMNMTEAELDAHGMVVGPPAEWEVMKTSELIAALQELQDQHGDLPVRLHDDEWGYRDEIVVEAGDLDTQEPFASLAGRAMFTPEVFADHLNRQIRQTPLDHWSWDPEHVEAHYGRILRRAGVTDIGAWVAAKRSAKP